MKKTLLTLTAAFISVAAWGQGAVTLNNRVTGVVDARIFGPAGMVLGAGWTAQLYGGPAGTAVDRLVPLFPTTTFRTSSAAAQGYLNAVDVTVPGVPPGSKATLVLRVFNGASFETSALRGQSSVITITLGGGTLPPANLAGLQWWNGDLFSGSWLPPSVITTPPVITVQPQSQTLVAGATITFSVTATGTAPLKYQWYKNKVLIAGATSATLMLSNASNADVAGYYVVVSNTAGSVTSSTVVLLTPPVISVHPKTQSLVVGSTITFSVSATGTAPLKYQWYRNSIPIAGATSATLTLSNPSNADVASYYVVVSNTAGSVTSATAYLFADGSGKRLVRVRLNGLAGKTADVSGTTAGSADATSEALRLTIETGLTLKLTGEAGTTNQIQYVTDLSETNGWLVLTNIVLSNNPSYFLDTSQEVRRFYRAVALSGSPATSTPANPDPARLVWIPPGTFLMGSLVSEQDRWGDEGPQTVVTLTKGFYLGKHEATQGEYQAVTGNNPSKFQGDLNRPVEQVSWDDAVSYCSKRTEQERAAGKLPSGWAYRLPTEAEWEYACRAGTTTRFYYGDDSSYSHLWNYAWYDSISSSTTHPVGQKQPNGWGLYDMAGNVLEWCSDWYRDSLPGGSLTDPKGPSSGSYLVIRGGSWDGHQMFCRSAYRSFHGNPFGWFGYLGFRVALSSVP